MCIDKLSFAFALCKSSQVVCRFDFSKSCSQYYLSLKMIWVSTRTQRSRAAPASCCCWSCTSVRWSSLRPACRWPGSTSASCRWRKQRHLPRARFRTRSATRGTRELWMQRLGRCLGVWRSRSVVWSLWCSAFWSTWRWSWTRRRFWTSNQTTALSIACYVFEALMVCCLHLSHQVKSWQRNQSHLRHQFLDVEIKWR